MNLETSPYLDQNERWPSAGRHILAHFDEETIVVYQAYRPEIGCYALEHGHFGGDFSYSRMSWIKPNFLWMMFRSGWGTKPGQEVTLGVRLRRSFFEEILLAAVPSSFGASGHDSKDAWEAAAKGSTVRLQWDPDHAPTGSKVDRRAVQLGLRGPMLASYGRQEALEIIDMREFVDVQRGNATPSKYQDLLTPLERVYTPMHEGLAQSLGLEATR